MEHQLSHLVFDLVGEHADGTQRNGAAAALVLLLHAPYFEGAHTSTWRLVDYQGQLTVAQYVRDEWRNRHPLDLYAADRTLVEHYVRMLDTVSEETERAAEAVLERVRDQHPQLWQLLMAPVPQQLAARRKLTYDILDRDELDARLVHVLGPTYRLDGSLATQGMEYHTAPGWNDGNMRYVLAHNENEVAGILGMSMFRQWTYGVNYVSVAPGFRQQGVARNLFSKVIEACVADQRVLVRTTPGEYASEHPGITAGFDRLCVQAPVLHVLANSTLMSAVGRGVERLGFDQAMRLYKPLCDRFDVGPERELWHNPELNSAIAALDTTLPVQGARPTRKPR